MASPSRLDLLTEGLCQAEVFRHLSSGMLETLVAAGADEAFPSGRCLTARTGEGDVVVVLMGAARLLWVTPDGVEVAYGRLLEGQISSVGAADAEPFGSTIAVTEGSATRVFYVDAERFADVATTLPQAGRELNRVVSRRSDERCRALADVAFVPLAERLYTWLRRLAAESPDGCVRQTHDQLARFVGASREAVTRTLIRLRDQGLISYTSHGHRIRVADPDEASAIYLPSGR